ncbi:diacylglycerol kinase [Nocardioides agariphilus]|jgi:YegS/Rv2252/BmrU family lipid kinase|uniref:Diacylglycerol kinase n=1 Tax=Nocardioides agariphilus TaxID=433664 RepID=A0A930YJ20_9ACTN|nr:diacylglycerol kinase family protein [Nocardioides agariphilus]MBF4768703.1 diacylglycerol kinase [Nocardioides agariphilus]
MDPLLVITNKDAGTADQETLDVALEILRSRTSVEVAATSDPGELDGVLQRAGSRRIVVAGGDGSLHAVMSALYRRNQLGDAVVALLPLGTGNDFARSVGIPLEIEDAARLVVDGEVRKTDLIIDEVGEIVVNNVHVGAGAEASRKGHTWKTRLGSIGVGKLNLGRLGYPIGAIQSAFNSGELHLRVEIDGKVVNDLDRPVLMVAVGNGANIGGGTEVTPHADPESRQVDVMVSRATSPLAKLGYTLKMARQGSHLERPDVDYYRGRSVSVSGEEFYCSADGEIYGPERQRTWHIEPAAYRFVLPA